MGGVAGGSGQEIRCEDTNPHSAQTEAETLEIEKEVYDALMKKSWTEVAKIYKTNKSVSTTINRVGDNILHLAILVGDEDGVIELMELMEKQDERRMEDIMQTKNDWGNTPLHQAASVGMHKLCSFMAKYYFTNKEPHRNNQCETPLHVAVVHGHKEAFVALQKVIERADWRDADRKDGGNTILHSAIFREHFDLALIIVRKYPKLMYYKNEEGDSTLHILANKPSAFKSGTHLSLLDNFIYHFPWTSDEDDKSKYIRDVEITISEPWNSDDDDRRKHSIDLEISAKKGVKQGDQANQENIVIQNQGIPLKSFFMYIFKQVCEAIVSQLLQICKYNKIKKMKTKHSDACRIMQELVSRTKGWQFESAGEKPKEANYDSNVGQIKPSQVLNKQANYDSEKEKQNQEQQDSGREKKSQPYKASPFLVAAKRGMKEMVKRILKESPVVAFDMDSDGKNIVLLAAEYRQIHIYKQMLKMQKKEIPQRMVKTLFGRLDKKGNSALHLAANFNREKNPWNIPGAALQILSKIKWYKYIEKSMEHGVFIHYNFERRTALEIFTDTHKDLIKDARKWLISTSQSCSVVAALIAAVAYTSATTVPGGNNQTTGFPIFESQRSFVVFAISSLVAMCSSVTALVFFLSILTSRFHESEFERLIPTKLIGGMAALFVSIVTNLVSFCAGHFYIIHHKLRSGVYVLYAVLSIPVMAIFFTSHFNLFVDTMKARFHPIPERTGELQFF